MCHVDVAVVIYVFYLLSKHRLNNYCYFITINNNFLKAPIGSAGWNGDYSFDPIFRLNSFTVKVDIFDKTLISRAVAKICFVKIFALTIS